MNNEEKRAAWSIYWSQNRLHSCVASENDQDQQILNDLWADLAKSLPTNAKVLDLATGNGAVPSAMLLVRPDLVIDAVDQADVDPVKFLNENELLRTVRFHSNTSILEMLFEAQQFDAITSQFGIEYAGLQEASIKIMPLIKPGGELLFFIHHQESALITGSKSKLEELRQITANEGLLSSLQIFLTDGHKLDKLNAAGERHLQGEFVRSNAISGQLFDGIEQVINTVSSDAEKARILAMSMDVRIRAEQQRLEQMVASSHSLQSIEQLCDLLKDQGLRSRFESIEIKGEAQEYLLCWKLSGIKS